MGNQRPVPHIQVCSLEAVREADVDLYDGVITIEDSQIEHPFRIEGDFPLQRVIRFDDVVFSGDEWIAPEEYHIQSALGFSQLWEQPSLLIHCHAGMSRSPAIALAIIADSMGKGEEAAAVRELLKTVPLCTPNQRVVEITDRILDRGGALLETLKCKLE